MSQKPSRDRVERWLDMRADPAEIWAAIGDFGALADWHPAIEKCEVVDLDGETHRHLTLGDGSLVLEKLLDTGPTWYRYAIIDAPLPVENYVSTLTCSDHEGDARVFWSATFEPTSPDADAIFAGFYESGLDALRERFGG